MYPVDSSLYVDYIGIFTWSMRRFRVNTVVWNNFERQGAGNTRKRYNLMDNVREHNRPPFHSLETVLRRTLVATLQAAAKRFHPAVLQEMVLSVGVELGRQEAAEYRLTRHLTGRFDSRACAACLEAVGKELGWELQASIESDSVICVDEHGCEGAKLGGPDPYLMQIGYGILGGIVADEFGYAKVCVTDYPEKLPFHRTIRISLVETAASLAEPGIVFPRIADETASLAEWGSDGGSGERLTPRETEVFTLIAHGLSDKEIAETLRLSVRTVQNHGAQIRHKLGLSSRTALVRLALRAPVGNTREM